MNSSYFEKIKTLAIQKAKELGEKAKPSDTENVAKNLDGMNKGPLKKVWNKVKAIWQAFLSPETPSTVKALLIGSLIYMILPIDILPDVVFPVGLLDDAAVIAFIYFQFKDIIEKAIPAISKQIDKTMENVNNKVSEMTETVIENTIGKKLNQFYRKVALTSAIKLLTFCSAILLLFLAGEKYIAFRYAACVLILFLTLWTLFSFVKNIINFCKILKRFSPEYKTIKTNEKLKCENKPDYVPLTKIEMTAEALYKAFANPLIAENHKKSAKFFSFMFCKWNEGRLPDIIPRKRALVTKVFDVVKIRLIIFLGSFTGYLLIYTFLIKKMLLQTVTDYTIYQLLLYPFVLAFSGGKGGF